MDLIGTDLDPSGRPGVLVGGHENLAEALLRRLRCPRGYLPHQPLYGSHLRRYVGQPFDLATALAVRAEVERTLLEDERVTRLLEVEVLGTESLDAFVVRVRAESVAGVVDLSGTVN